MKNWSFATNNDKLISLVLKGQKRATSYLYKEEDIPVIGEESIIHFDNEKDACIVKTINYKILKFKDVKEEDAILEGEGDLSLDYWKKVHEEFFKNQKKNFTIEDKIIFEEFEMTKNLVEERLKLGKSIASKNLDILKNINSISEINSGFNNTLFNINDKYVLKVCTNKSLEKTFQTEYNFYSSNKENKYIPKLYKYDDSKKDSEFIYEIIEKLEGNTLYYYWYKMNESEKENTIKNLMEIIKKFHSKKSEGYNWATKIKNDVLSDLEECKSSFSSKEYDIIIKSINNYDLFLKDNRFTLIHNDLHFDNVIYNNGILKIIDFNDSLIAPIDFEFRQLYSCQEKPWKYANIEMDPFQKPNDYKNIWNYIKQYYEELNDIEYLEQRMLIYKVWNSIRNLKKYKLQELIDDVVNSSKKLSDV